MNLSSTLPSSTTCFTSASSIFYSFAEIKTPENLQDLCNGRGRCLTAPADSHFGAMGRGLCECTGGFTGASDYFDLRVMVDPTTGKSLALNCMIQSTAHQVIWSILVAAVIVRWLIIGVALFRQIRSKGRRSGGLQGCFEYGPYRYLTFDLLIASPIMFAGALMKAIDIETSVHGTAAAATVTLVLGTSFSNVAYGEFCISQFKAITGAKTMGSSLKSRPLVERYRIAMYGMLLVYFLLACVPAFVALRLDKSLGPIQSKEFVILVFRNAGVLSWLLAQIAVVRWLKNEVKDLKLTVDDSGSSSKPKPSLTGAQRSTDTIINFLNDSTQHVVLETAVGLALYFPLCFPALWPYISYVTGIGLIMATYGSNEGLILLKTARIAKKSKEQQQALMVGSSKQLNSPMSPAHYKQTSDGVDEGSNFPAGSTVG